MSMRVPGVREAAIAGLTHPPTHLLPPPQGLSVGRRPQPLDLGAAEVSVPVELLGHRDRESAVGIVIIFFGICRANHLPFCL